MKKAFTMIELVFVIVVVGILSYMVASSFTRNPLREAADQVVSHIRYTQHLAMTDDKFVPNISLSTTSGFAASREVEFWYKGRWQLAFHKETSGTKCTSTDSVHWSYSVFSDGPGKPNLATGGYTGNPDDSEIAKNPLDPTRYLTGGYTTSTVACTDKEATKTMNLGYTYGIKDVNFAGGCDVSDNRNQRLAFDFLGRPLYDKIDDLDSVYYEGSRNLLIISQCRIELCQTVPCSSATSDEKITIAVEPETGYAHILSN